MLFTELLFKKLLLKEFLFDKLLFEITVQGKTYLEPKTFRDDPPSFSGSSWVGKAQDPVANNRMTRSILDAPGKKEIMIIMRACCVI